MPKEFCQGCLSLPKSKLRQAITAAKLSISSSKAELLIEKNRKSMRWARAKLRNSGSGVFLPAEVKTLGKLWARAKVPSTKTPKEKALKEPKGKVMESDAEKQDNEASVRELFGLPEQPTQKAAVDDEIMVSSSSDEAPPMSLPASSSAVDPGSCVGAKKEPQNHSHPLAPNPNQSS